MLRVLYSSAVYENDFKIAKSCIDFGIFEVSCWDVSNFRSVQNCFSGLHCYAGGRIPHIDKTVLVPCAFSTFVGSFGDDPTTCVVWVETFLFRVVNYFNFLYSYILVVLWLNVNNLTVKAVVNCIQLLLLQSASNLFTQREMEFHADTHDLYREVVGQCLSGASAETLSTPELLSNSCY